MRIVVWGVNTAPEQIEVHDIIKGALQEYILAIEWRPGHGKDSEIIQIFDVHPDAFPSVRSRIHTSLQQVRRRCVNHRILAGEDRRLLVR